MAIIYGLKVNLSVAMVAMVNHTAVGHVAAMDNHTGTISLTSSVETCAAENKTGGSTGSEVNKKIHQSKWRITILNF